LPFSNAVGFFLCRILALEKLGAVFNQISHPLKYTPRKFVIDPESNNLVIIETDHNAFTDKGKADRKQLMAEVTPYVN
jgi:splicing factor 3B subunit 3